MCGSGWTGTAMHVTRVGLVRGKVLHEVREGLAETIGVVDEVRVTGIVRKSLQGFSFAIYVLFRCSGKTVEIHWRHRWPDYFYRDRD